MNIKVAAFTESEKSSNTSSDKFHNITCKIIHASDYMNLLSEFQISPDRFHGSQSIQMIIRPSYQSFRLVLIDFMTINL